MKTLLAIASALLAVLLLTSDARPQTITLQLPIEREDGTPLQCELASVRAYFTGDCARFTALDSDGRESVKSASSACTACTADLNHDGVVNASDLAILKSQYFMSCQ